MGTNMWVSNCRIGQVKGVTWGRTTTDLPAGIPRMSFISLSAWNSDLTHHFQPMRCYPDKLATDTNRLAMPSDQLATDLGPGCDWGEALASMWPDPGEEWLAVHVCDTGHWTRMMANPCCGTGQAPWLVHVCGQSLNKNDGRYMTLAGRRIEWRPVHICDRLLDKNMDRCMCPVIGQEVMSLHVCDLSLDRNDGHYIFVAIYFYITYYEYVTVRIHGQLMDRNGS